MPETLPVERRRSLAVRDVYDAFRQTVTNRQTLGYALTAGGVLGSLFAFVFTAQQVFTEIYQARDTGFLSHSQHAPSEPRSPASSTPASSTGSACA